MRFTRHGSLVMDWVEVFAPVVFEPYRPRAWPESGSLLLDDLPFRVRNPRTGRTLVAFRVFAALGYERGRPKLWRLQAFTSKSQTDWEAFLAALPGARKRVVCDNDDGLTGAVRALFPDAELYLCEWHLRHALERLMVNLRREQPEHREALDELLAGTEAAFTGVLGPLALYSFNEAHDRRLWRRTGPRTSAGDYASASGVSGSSPITCAAV